VFFWNPIWPGARGESGRNERTGIPVSREREERRAKVLRLAMLGWTQKEIAELLGVSQQTVSVDTKNCDSAKIGIRDLASQHIERHEIARRFNLRF
jgi:DNA-binding NarL/FixJ family response regulator